MLMAKTEKEIKEQLEQINTLKEEAEAEYKKAIKAGLKKHEECCPDICDTINVAIKSIETKIEEFEALSEKHLTPKIDKSISRNLPLLKERHDELTKIVNRLKERGICDCAR